MTEPPWLEQRPSRDGRPRWFWTGGVVPTIDPDRIRAIRWGYVALQDSAERCAASYATSGRKMWAGAVEGVWWSRALDENLEALLEGHVPYEAARDSCREGRIVRGMRWLRNRHAHDLSVTGHGGPKKGMFSGPGVIYISPYNRWKASTDVLVGHDRSTSRRPDYDDHVAGLPVEESLRAAREWFGRVLQACDIDTAEPEGTDETVM